MLTTSPTLPPVARPAGMPALGEPALAPIPVAVVQAAPPKPVVVAPVIKPVANIPIARRRAVVESPRAVASDRPARRPDRVSPASAGRFVGSVSVVSEPAGARVFVNGQSAGVTPLLLDAVPVGSRAIRVEADGYAALSSVVRVVANQRTTLRATLSSTSSN